MRALWATVITALFLGAVWAFVWLLSWAIDNHRDWILGLFFSVVCVVFIWIFVYIEVLGE